MNADLEIYLTRAGDTLLALGVLADRIDVGLLVGLDAEKRRAWAAKVAKQLLRGDLDYSPPALVVDPDPGFAELPIVGDEPERYARRKVNEYLRDRAAGRVAKISVPDYLLPEIAKIAPDLHRELTGPDLWGKPRDQVGSPIDIPHRSQDVAPNPLTLPDEVPGATVARR
jgi:hypothetical protein